MRYLFTLYHAWQWVRKKPGAPMPRIYGAIWRGYDRPVEPLEFG